MDLVEVEGEIAEDEQEWIEERNEIMMEETVLGGVLVEK